MASITCGNCKGTHSNVVEVKSCYAAQTQPVGTFAVNGAGFVIAAPASEAQVSYLRSLLVKHGADQVEVDAVEAKIAANDLSKKAASAAIENLKSRPVVAHAPASSNFSVPEVPAGHYAVEIDGVLKFYKVDRPTEGRWAGRTFVKVQASDDLYAVRGAGAAAVLKAIAADPKTAMLRYGQEIGSCGHCHRTLTNEESRAAGIGPVCRGKMGW